MCLRATRQIRVTGKFAGHFRVFQARRRFPLANRRWRTMLPVQLGIPGAHQLLVSAPNSLKGRGHHDDPQSATVPAMPGYGTEAGQREAPTRQSSLPAADNAVDLPLHVWHRIHAHGQARASGARGGLARTQELQLTALAAPRALQNSRLAAEFAGPCPSPGRSVRRPRPRRCTARCRSPADEAVCIPRTHETRCRTRR